MLTVGLLQTCLDKVLLCPASRWGGLPNCPTRPRTFLVLSHAAHTYAGMAGTQYARYTFIAHQDCWDAQGLGSSTMILWGRQATWL